MVKQWEEFNITPMKFFLTLIVLALLGTGGWYTYEHQEEIFGEVFVQFGEDVVQPEDSPMELDTSLTVLSSHETEKPLQPQAFISLTAEFADAVTALNLAELAFIEANGNEPSAEELDEDLLVVAAAAMKVGVIADQLSLTMAAQAGASAEAQKMAGQFQEFAKVGYVLVIEAQDARDDIKADPAQANLVAGMLAEFGVRLWNPEVTEQGNNPFFTSLPGGTQVEAAQFLEAEVGSALFAKSSMAVDFVSALNTHSVIPYVMGFDPQYSPIDAAIMQVLTKPDGQRDGKLARASAASALAKTSGTTSAAGQITTAIINGAAVLKDPYGTIVPHIPTFTRGAGVFIGNLVANQVKGQVDEGIAIGADLIGFNSPTITAQVPIKPVTQAAVALKITGVNRPSDAQSTVQVSVQWSATVAGGFTISCQVPGYSGNAAVEVASASGSQALTVNFSRSYSDKEIQIFCFAKAEESGPTLGSASASVVATTKPNTPPEGEEETKPEEAPPAVQEEPTPPAPPKPPAAAGDSSWIEPYVASVETQLLNDKKDPIAVAIVTDNLRDCLVLAVEGGKNEAEAKSACKSVEALAGTPPTTTTSDTPTSTGSTGPSTASISASFTETVASGSAKTFGTTATLNFDYANKTVTGTLSGSSGREIGFDCFLGDAGNIVDHATADYSFSYSSAVTGSFDPASGSFTANISPSGNVGATVTKYYSHAECTHMNDNPPGGTGPFAGSGTITGTVDSSGAASLTTSWTAEGASVTGAWAGSAAVR